MNSTQHTHIHKHFLASRNFWVEKNTHNKNWAFTPPSRPFSIGIPGVQALRSANTYVLCKLHGATGFRWERSARGQNGIRQWFWDDLRKKCLDLSNGITRRRPKRHQHNFVGYICLQKREIYVLRKHRIHHSRKNSREQRETSSERIM